MLERFSDERNHAENTRKSYETVIRDFEKQTGKPLNEMLQIAEDEKRTPWEDTQLRKWLIQYRNHLYNNYRETSATKLLARVRTVFRHYNIPIGKLPYFSTKQAKKSEEIDYEDLPNREILKKCIEVKNPLLKALTLFMSSTGISRTDTWNLTIQNYLDSTREYHHTDDIYKAINIMENQQVIPSFKLKRRKTGETYRTFASHEAVKAINNYLLTRQSLENNDKLFNIGLRHFSQIFKDTNDLLGLGTVNGRARFSPQMLRVYHATQLAEAGMNDSHIDLVQGRKPHSIARKSYIRVKRERLKEEYIKALPYLVIEDTERIKTELETVKEENTQLHSELDGILERIKRLEERPSWEEFVNDPKH
jgi:site-specific recombinase XerD